MWGCAVEESWVTMKWLGFSKSSSGYTTATIFPSVECADEKVVEFKNNPLGRTVSTPIEPPVWRSQVTRSVFLKHVKKRLSGEKLSLGPEPEGDSKMFRMLRVTASRISTAPVVATAMNLLHGDQEAMPLNVWRHVDVTTTSHEVDNPCTTLAKGR